MYRKGLLKILIAGLFVLFGCSQEDIKTKDNNIIVSTNTSLEESPVAENPSFVWELSEPVEQGIDLKVLHSIDDEIKKNHPKVLSFLLVKEGHIIYEKYYGAGGQDSYTGVFSVTKSILSALTGMAIEQGYLTGVDQQISSILQEDYDYGPSESQMTIHHLLSMTGGLESVDNNIGSWFRSPDWLAYAMNLPRDAEPGTTFSYNTGLTHVLSAVLTEATGMTTNDFADQYLFWPLDITNYVWEQAPEGIYVGGTNLFLTSRDMAKFGYLYLSNGNWKGEQIIPQKWIEASIQQQANDEQYGYLFWVKNMEGIESKQLFTYEANGYGGQHIRIIPELETVIVMTSDPNSRNSDTYQLIEEQLIPALAASLK